MMAIVREWRMLEYGTGTVPVEWVENDKGCAFKYGAV